MGVLGGGRQGQPPSLLGILCWAHMVPSYSSNLFSSVPHRRARRVAPRHLQCTACGKGWDPLPATPAAVRPRTFDTVKQVCVAWCLCQLRIASPKGAIPPLTMHTTTGMQMRRSSRVTTGKTVIPEKKYCARSSGPHRILIIFYTSRRTTRLQRQQGCRSPVSQPKGAQGLRTVLRTLTHTDCIPSLPPSRPP